MYWYSISKVRDPSSALDPLGLRRVDSTPAAELVASEIRRGGPITFHRFMEIALYDPQVGYYPQAGPAVGPGAQADFVTSPEVQGAFATLVTVQIEELWRLLGRPEPFWFIEGGPGTGRLAADLLAVADAAYPELAAALRVALIERSTRLRDVQRARLAPWAGGSGGTGHPTSAGGSGGTGHPTSAGGSGGAGHPTSTDRVTWLGLDPATWPCLGAGCVFANELLDAFPVHRLVGTSRGVNERFIDIDDDRLVEVERRVTSDALIEQIRAGGGELPAGCLGEVNLEAPAWVARSGELIERGYVLIVDYGEPADDLYGAKRAAGTLRAYQRHVLSADLLATPGRQDITAHVDLSAVVRAAEGGGLQLLGSTRQAAFLARLGLGELVARMQRRVAGRAAQWASSEALATLVARHGMGNLAVLLFGKEAPGRAPVGFGGEGPVTVPDVAATWRLGDAAAPFAS